MVALSLALSVGCGGDGLSAADATRLAEPYLAHFETFDRWARRTVSADPAFRNRASLEETLFAPIRRHDQVRAVWIHRGEGDRPLSWGTAEEPAKETEWARIENDDLGTLDVTTIKVGESGGRRRAADSGEQCVVIRRAHAGADGEIVTVAVAYQPPDED